MTEPSTETQKPARMRSRGLVVSMVVAILAVVALAYVDNERESVAALDDFAHEQSVLAASVSAEVATRLAFAAKEGAPLDDTELSPSLLARESMRIERPGELMIALIRPEGDALRATDGRALTAPRVLAAFRAGQSVYRLSRPESEAVGLPARMAMAGLSSVDAGKLGRWGVVVITSAARARDREFRARARLLSSVLLAVGLVTAFGTFALRRQRTELTLAHDLEMAEMQRRRDERLLRASKVGMMGTFATGVAHEISTPLAVIAGRADQLLARATEDERLHHGLSIIVEQTQRIGAIIRGFLDMARGGRPVISTVSPASLVEGASRLVEHRFEKAGVTLRCDVPAGLAPVSCDVRLLEHAIMNLLLNACEACDRGGQVEVMVRAEESHLAFDVLDDGLGISTEDAAHAADPFFTTKPAGQGTGLGLAITNEIVKSHRGSLSIAPRAPRGTRACIEIPVQQPARGS